VIDAFNRDKPYDRFVREQLAGDELDDVTQETIIATGYHRLMIWDDEPGMSALQGRYDVLDDLVSTTAQAFLGMTLGCARCHDHKKDPIPQADYYRFMAFFHGVSDMSKDGIFTDIMSASEREDYERQVAAKKQDEDALLARIASLEADLARGNGALDEAGRESLSDLQRELRAVRERAIPRAQAAAVQESGPVPAALHVHRRGNAAVLGEAVEPAFPACLHPPPAVIPAPPAGARSSGRRRVLADWIASPDNPRTARVLANRLWQHHFGRGIVRTANDFGGLGSGATHPELLDWLAAELIARGWSCKAMHRLIMTSASYRMGSNADGKARREDPTNDLLTRVDLRRLSAEELRDSLLVLTGKLERQVGGPSIFVPMPEEALATSSRPDEVWGTSPLEQTWRRSIYIKVKRSLIAPILQTFDFPDTDTSCPERFTTTLPTQALAMLNSELVQGHAADFAARLAAEAGDEPRAQIRLALRLATCREPRGDEIESCARFLDGLREEPDMTPQLALRTFCLMVFSLNEFAYVE
jgi:hypothetical protein